MLRIAEHLAVYSAVAGIIWWDLFGPPADHQLSAAAALTAIGLLALLLLREVLLARHAACERREAENGRAAVVEAERLRRRAYDLCAGLRLGFDICEQCWVRHPDQAARELDRLRAAVGQFVVCELGLPVSE